MKPYKTKKQRLQIYKDLLIFLQTEEASEKSGFCIMMEDLFNIYIGYASYILYNNEDAKRSHLGRLFPELWETMTEFNHKPLIYWFPAYKHEGRIKLLQRVIEKMT